MISSRLFGPGGAPGAPGLVGLNTAGGAKPPLPALQVITTSATDTVILNPALGSATQALVLSIPAMGPIATGLIGAQLEQQPFRIIASGYYSTGTSTTCTIKLWSGTSTTTGSDTNIATSGAITAISGKTPWLMICDCIYDSVSGKLNGTSKWIANGTLVAEAAFATVITGLASSGAGQGAPIFNLVLSCAFATGNAANQINVQEFCVAA